MSAVNEFYIDAKSAQRMEDIKRKAESGTRSTTDYCRQMADTIKDTQKAFYRYEAACHVFGLDSREAAIFFRRAIELGHPEAMKIQHNQTIIRTAEVARKEEEERRAKFKLVSLAYDLVC